LALANAAGSLALQLTDYAYRPAAMAEWNFWTFTMFCQKVAKGVAVQPTSTGVVPPPQGDRWSADEVDRYVTAKRYTFNDNHPQLALQEIRLRREPVCPRVQYCPSTRGTSERYRHDQALWILLTLRPWFGELTTTTLLPIPFFDLGRSLPDVVAAWQASMETGVDTAIVAAEETRAARVQLMQLRYYRSFVRCHEDAAADRERRTAAEAAARDAGADGGAMLDRAAEDLEAGDGANNGWQQFDAGSNDGQSETSDCESDAAHRTRQTTTTRRALVAAATRALHYKSAADASSDTPMPSNFKTAAVATAR
jgi:hypothetical protein